MWLGFDFKYPKNRRWVGLRPRSWLLNNETLLKLEGTYEEVGDKLNYKTVQTETPIIISILPLE